MDSLNGIRAYLVLQILKENTDKDHTITIAQILRLLEEKHGIKAYRATIQKDIELLNYAGCGIEFIKSSQNHYRFVKWEIDDADLKVIIDAVASAKFITKEKSLELTSRLTKLAGPFASGRLTRNMEVERRIKSGGEQLYSIRDTINEAINTGRQIRFQYFGYSEKKKHILRQDGQYYTVSPYRLVWNGEYHYVIGCARGFRDVMAFRTDRIADVPEILDKAAVSVPKKRNLDKFLDSYQVFNTERQKIQLICDNDTMDYIIDRFGESVKTKKYDAAHFEADIKADASNLFYSWIFSLEGRVKIAGPEEVRERYREMVRRAAGEE